MGTREKASLPWLSLRGDFYVVQIIKNLPFWEVQAARSIYQGLPVSYPLPTPNSPSTRSPSRTRITTANREEFILCVASLRKPQDWLLTRFYHKERILSNAVTA